MDEHSVAVITVFKVGPAKQQERHYLAPLDDAAAPEINALAEG